jgi:prevent-host-death family protein
MVNLPCSSDLETMMGSKSGTSRPRPARAAFAALLEPGELSRWQLRDAKAQFDHVVRLAAAGVPQCVSICGSDSVVIVRYDHFMDAVRPKDSLLDFFQASPFLGVDIQCDRLPGNLRQVKL